jgi:GST-like protein
MCLPEDHRGRWEALQWLMFQMGGVGPMLGQAHHFNVYAPERIPYAMDRYSKEANRLYGVLDRRLAESEFVGGGAYSVADIAVMPWLRSFRNQNVDMDAYPHVKRWFDAMNARPAVQRGLQVLSHIRRPPPGDPTVQANYFGAAQYRKR